MGGHISVGYIFLGGWDVFFLLWALEGRKEGRKEGRQEGRKEGDGEARKEGRKEGRKLHFKGFAAHRSKTLRSDPGPPANSRLQTSYEPWKTPQRWMLWATST